MNFEFTGLGDLAPVRKYGVNADPTERLLQWQYIRRWSVGMNNDRDEPGSWCRDGVTECVLGLTGNRETRVRDEGANLLNECSALGLGADVRNRYRAFRSAGQSDREIAALLCYPAYPRAYQQAGAERIYLILLVGRQGLEPRTY